PPRPSLLAIPPTVELPSACSTCGAVSTVPSVLPSQDAASEARPADLNLSVNAPIPPAHPVLRCTTSCTSPPPSSQGPPGPPDLRLRCQTWPSGLSPIWRTRGVRA